MSHTIRNQIFNLSEGSGIGIQTWPPLITANLVIEGHSFIAPLTALEEYSIGSINIVSVYNAAVAGSFISDCVTRAAVTDSKLVVGSSSLRNVLLLSIGANDFDNTLGGGLNAYNSLKPYVQARLAAGWEIFIFTVTPSTSGGKDGRFEVERDTFNGLLRTDLALLPKVYILDSDTIAALDNSADPVYYGDLLHPTKSGAYLLSTLFLNSVNTVYKTSATPTVSFIPEVPLTLTSLGTGAGISLLKIYSSENTRILLDGSALFYTDAAGTIGGFSLWTVVPGAERIIYIKCPLGLSNFSIEKNKITRITQWTSGANSAILGGSINPMTSLVFVGMQGNMSITGDIQGLVNLYSVYISGQAGYYSQLNYTRVNNCKSLCSFRVAVKVLTAANVNQLLADMWANKDEATRPIATRLIDLMGGAGSSAPTGQGATDKAALAAYRSPNNDAGNALWTVTTRL